MKSRVETHTVVYQIIKINNKQKKGPKENNILVALFNMLTMQVLSRTIIMSSIA